MNKTLKQINVNLRQWFFRAVFFQSKYRKHQQFNLNPPFTLPIRKYLVGFWILTSLLFMWLTLAIAINTPWLGFDAKYDIVERKLVVTQVSPKGPATGKLMPGDTILYFENDLGVGFHPQADLNTIGTLYNRIIDPKRWFDFHTERYLTLNSPTIRIALDSKEILLNTEEQLPLHLLPLVNGLSLLCALLITGFSLYCWTKQHPLQHYAYLSVSGIAASLAIVSITAYNMTVFTINPIFLYYGSVLSLFFIMLFAYGVSIFLLQYPNPYLYERKKQKRIKHTLYLCFILALIIINADFILAHGEEEKTIKRSPIFLYPAVFFAFLIPYLLTFILIFQQWSRTQHLPFARAKLQWVLITIISLHIILLLFFWSPTTSFYSMSLEPHNILPFVIFLLYLGFACAAANFRLQNVESWLFTIVCFYLTLGPILFIDSQLPRILGFSQDTAHFVTLLVGGWLYFPIKRLARSFVLEHQDLSTHDYIAEYLESIYPIESGQEYFFEESFLTLIHKVFNPQHIHWHNAADCFMPECKVCQVKVATIIDSGLALTIPFEIKQKSLVVKNKSHGLRLFNHQDLKTIQELQLLATRGSSISEVREKAKNIERIRIMRDLEDEVGTELASLVQNAENDKDREKASNALRMLTDSIYSLDKQNHTTHLQRCLNNWHEEIAQRLQESKVDFITNIGIRASAFTQGVITNEEINARQKINIERILKESITNAICHAYPSFITMDFRIEHQCLNIQMTHDGKINPIEDWEKGKGINNIKTRTHEINGSVTWESHFSGRVSLLTFKLSVPLQTPPLQTIHFERQRIAL